MPVNNINATAQRPEARHFINPRSTGYLAASSVVLSAASGAVKSKSFRKSHKYFAGLSVVAIAAHIYSLSKFRHHRKNAG